jgi:two-component system, LytTR family, response regulator
MTDAPAAGIRVAIVDDEPLARAVIREYLAAVPDIDVVAECANGFEAVKVVSELHPDLLFLDVQMPKLDGFEVLELVGRDVSVVFVTAYDEYAIRAFDVHAIDYLLKPFSAERFRSSLAHARVHVATHRAQPGTERERGKRDRLMVKSDGRIRVIRTADIDWCEASGNYVGLHVGAQCHFVRDTMAHLESKLDPSQFIRIHRSTIVNVDRVQEMQPSFSGDYVVILRGGTRLTLSRGYRDVMQARLGRPL